MAGTKSTRWVPLHSATRIQVQCFRQNCQAIMETTPSSLHNIERCIGCNQPFSEEQMDMIHSLGGILLRLASDSAEQDEYTDKEFGIRFWADAGPP